MRLLACIFVLLSAAAVRAQSGEPEETAESAQANAASQSPSASNDDDSALFAAGVAAIADQRFASARDLLRRALALSPRTATAFNLAIALRGTGEASEGVVLLEALAEGEYGSLAEAQLAQVEVLRRELASDLARLRVNTTPDADILIDAQPQPMGEWIRVDPGSHVIEAEAEGYERRIERIDLSRGQRREIDLELVATPDASRPSRAWIWALVGVLAAGGVALAVGLSLRRDPQPIVDPVFGNTEALSWH